MRETKRKLSVFMAAVMVILMFSPLFSSNVAKADEPLGTVTVIFENTTFKEYEGTPAAWTGTFSTEVGIKADSTMMSLIEEAGDENHLKMPVVESNGYINKIGELDPEDAGMIDSGYGYSYGAGGFMGTLNGWFTSSGFDSYSVENGAVKDGDVFKIMYTVEMGADIGNDWNNSNNTDLNTLGAGRGSLDKTFVANTHEYTLTLPKGTEKVMLSPVAVYGSNQIRMYVNEFAPDKEGYDPNNDSFYESGKLIPVEDGDIIYIGLMQYIYDYNTYATNLVMAENEYVVNIKISDEVAGVNGLENIYKASGDYIESITTPEVGNEWLILSLARDGRVKKEFADKYLAAVKKALDDNGSDVINKDYSSTNSLDAIVLTALDFDADKVGDHNLLAPLGDFNYAGKGGVYSLAYALLALDSADYELSKDATTTRDKLIEAIAASQLSDGGFAWEGATAGDTDTTAMILTALAPYADGKAKAVVEKAIDFLSKAQNADGSYSSVFSGPNTETAAQVLIALSALGIDPAKDERFIKNGYTVLEAVTAFYLGGGKFAHVAGGSEDYYADYQAYQSLVAYFRMVKGDRSFYDVRDKAKEEPAPVATKDTGDKTSPKTGDSGSVALCTVFAVISLIAVVSVKKKKEVQ